MPETILRVESATVAFGPLRAVDGVSFTLTGGDLLGLIGPNGAGKTTLMRAITGLQQLSAGRVHILDQLLDGDRSILAHVGFTPDTPAMYDNLTVRDFLRFIGRGYNLSLGEADERIEFWLDKVWLREKADQKIQQLSRGMRQRVGIARTLLPNPTLILLDEPAAGLDPAGRAQFRQLLMNLRDQSKALIVSSHILADMEEYCSHIAMMSAGKIVRLGTVAEISHSSSDRCRYTVHLAGSLGNARSAVLAIEGVSQAEFDTERFVLEYHSGKTAAAELLAELMKLQLPIASFTANTLDLEEAYLRSGIRQVD